MPSGKFWSGTLPAGENQDTGAVPAGRVRTVSIIVVNLGAAATTLKVYISTSAVPTDASRIEPTLTLPAGGVFRLIGEPVGAGERVVLDADGENVVARISGFEEDE